MRQAFLYVQTGDAEAALVSHALADDPAVRLIEIDPAVYAPIIQGLGIVAATRAGDRAAALAEFVLGEEGQAILRKHGFLSPVPRTERLWQCRPQR